MSEFPDSYAMPHNLNARHRRRGKSVQYLPGRTNIKNTYKYLALNIKKLFESARERLVNNRYSFRQAAEYSGFCVKKRKKNRMHKHSVEIGVNRHSEMNDGNK
ncbi:hypothetical protein FNI11_12145 [Salmonella enterica subsp. salamae]|nr:hypothetical protein [Salmonella enterica subsp. salamae]ECJ2281554.1 hypothetical protein [Salmonella enterica subsp. salamae]